MTDNHWWFLVFLIVLVVLGFKLLVWLLFIAVLVWLVKTPFKEVKGEDIQSSDSQDDD